MDLRKRVPDSRAGQDLRTAPTPTGSSGVRPSGRGLLAINARYFALRFVVFLVTLIAVLALGVHEWLAFALAVVLSGLVSYPLALRQRRAVLGALQQRRGWLR
ncbi:hypothetical protein [Frankia sp. Cppng1_Ct_nod]|uniref:hypothetical protein n=1 Tax=Frankia sp. Cppng1_Ct_nod TaxID=2897162 RepID=UPI001040E7F7|nr:hypothetical protein [Frankia sp. Cppng1_Ct_nod]